MLTAPPAGRPVRIEFKRRVRDLDDSLWGACFPEPLEGRFWYEALEGSGLEDQFAFHYAVIRAGDEAVGIAPCFVHDVPLSLVAPAAVARLISALGKGFPSLAHQRTFFIGSPCADAGTVGLKAGTSLGEVIVPLWEACRTKARSLHASMVVFKDFESADLPALLQLRTAARFFPMLSYPGTVVALPGSNKDGYLTALSGPHRHNMLKKLRRSKELQPLENSVISNPSDAELREIFGLFLQTYERGKTKFERLGLKFFEQIRGREPVRFILQRDPVTRELLTFMLVFRIGQRVINKFIGIDYRRAGKTFLYFRLFEAAVEYAYSVGATELQSGQTGYRAKIDLGHRLVPLYNLARHRNPLVNAIYRFIGSRVTWRSLDEDLAHFLDAHPDREVPAQF